MFLLLYFVLIALFYGFSNNYGFHIKFNKVKVISTIIFAIITMPLPIYHNDLSKLF